MGFFSSSKPTSNLDWTDLSTLDQWSAAWKDESNRVYCVFKHSTRCGISSMALKGFERGWNQELEVETMLLDLLKHRDISARIAEDTGVMHQSPQCIVFQAGKIIYTATHHSIDAAEINNLLSA